MVETIDQEGAALPTIEVNGTTLAYDDTGGDGPAVVFSHSLYFDRSMFEAQVARFGRAFRVVTYDHRGQGGSARSSSVDMDTLTEDAAALIEALSLGPAHLVGNAMGGFVVLRLVARHPELVRSAAVLASSADEEPEECTILPLDALMFGETTLTERVALRDRWCEHFGALDSSALTAAEGVLSRKGVLDELVDATVPMLVLSADEDNVYPRPHSQRIADTAANTHHVTVKRAGNSLAVERPDAVNALLAEHFDAV
ncbi:alpha/beta fold hydrolase [Actinophytocola oryzae]|uniref:3-oxoadipate enol-lactonase n=1 Tax=Actinophytocola oryzae TaxID=502181 RepID=A0A4R7VTE7_9PSEU|nr:alpha/beta hydrolase [Actinophytocola oryzae]TDV52487.1 3-oxoadipate enol-lactonase [Actinophytocola oryzae]